MKPPAYGHQGTPFDDLIDFTPGGYSDTAPGAERADSSGDEKPEPAWRIDETYIRAAGRWTCLYRAIDSAGDTIGFLLSPYRDAIPAAGFFRVAIAQTGCVQPRVININGHPAYPTVSTS
jgi:transposase-like protein